MTPAEEDALVLGLGVVPDIYTIRLAIRAAVAQERERCARACEAKSKRLAKLGLHNEAAVLDDCAAAIRRGE